MRDPLDRIGVFMLADPVLGISLEQAKQALDAVLAFNEDGLYLGRAGMTGQCSTTTKWQWLLEYIHYAVVERGQGSAVHIYGDLQGMTQSLARDIREMGVRIFGEWFGPSLDETGVRAMMSQGSSRDKAEAMLEGIQNALAVKALTGIEFQINRWNIEYLEPFVQLCLRLGVDPHLEMQEMQFERGGDLVGLRRVYQERLPSQEQLRQAARMVADLTGQGVDEVLSPFFCLGNSGLQYGQCNYWFENGLFVWPDGKGGLVRTACLSDKTIIDPRFEPSVRRLEEHLGHPLVAMRRSFKQGDMAETKCATCQWWGVCRSGCRAMAFLASGSDFAPDPNCWKE